MKAQYFDLSVKDVDAAKRFFESCLGWRFEPFGPIPGYYRIQAGEAGEPGIDGGLGASAEVPFLEGQPLTIVTIRVDDVDAVVAKVMANGGRIVEPTRTIPGIGRFCTAAEPGGLLFGLLQVDQEAT